MESAKQDGHSAVYEENKESDIRRKVKLYVLYIYNIYIYIYIYIYISDRTST